MAQTSLVLKNLEDLQRLAAIVADKTAQVDVVLLKGTLGVGKSAFARCFLTHLDDTITEIPSPTFTLVQTYNTPTREVWHFDLYRLEDPEEVYEIGIEEAFVSGVSLIEWPERFYYQHLRDYLLINIDFMPSEAGARQVTLDGVGRWADQLVNIQEAYDS